MNYCVLVCITNFTNCSAGLLAAKSIINKVIFKHTLHKTHVNEYRMLILLSKYQNSNEYPHESNICCSPSVLDNFRMNKFIKIFMVCKISLEKVIFVVKIVVKNQKQCQAACVYK